MSWRRQNEAIGFFEPNGKQEEFINLFGSAGSAINVFSASNSLGKTTLIVNLLGNLVFGPQNRYFNQEIFKNWPFPKRARFITDPKLVEEIAPFQTEILKWWPKARYEAIKSGKTYYSQYRANGWVIDVMSYDQDPRQFEGSTLGLLLFDEPPPENLWTPSIRGLRGKGKACVFMTPLTHAGWFYDKIVPEYPNSIVYGSMEDGCKVHGVRGHLDHEQIESQIRQWMIMAPEEVEARAYGKALYLQNIIFSQFNASVHVTKSPIQAPNENIYQVIDPHSDKPFAIIYAFPDILGNVYIYDEWPKDDFYTMHNCQLNLKDYQRIFRDIEAGRNVSRRIIDRHFAQMRSVYNKKNLMMELSDLGLMFEPSYHAQQEEGEMETGILKVRQYLAYDPTKEVDGINRPKLYISPTCKNTIKSLSRWSRDAKGDVMEKYKDFCDCVRYLCMANPQISQPVPYREPVRRYG